MTHSQINVSNDFYLCQNIYNTVTISLKASKYIKKWVFLKVWRSCVQYLKTKTQENGIFSIVMKTCVRKFVPIPASTVNYLCNWVKSIVEVYETIL